MVKVLEKRLSLRWIWVIPVAMLSPYLTCSTMNTNFFSLVLGNLSCTFECLTLCGGYYRCTLGVILFCSPIVAMFYNMNLSSLCHYYLLSVFKDYLGLELVPRPHQKYQFSGYSYCREVRYTNSCLCCKPFAHEHQQGLPSDGNLLHGIYMHCGLHGRSNNPTMNHNLMVLNNGLNRLHSLRTFYITTLLCGLLPIYQKRDK